MGHENHEERQSVRSGLDREVTEVAKGQIGIEVRRISTRCIRMESQTEKALKDETLQRLSLPNRLQHWTTKPGAETTVSTMRPHKR